MFIQEFDPEIKVEASAAKHDKIELELGDYFVAALSSDDIEMILDRLGSPPTISKTSRKREDHRGTYGWIFNRIAKTRNEIAECFQNREKFILEQVVRKQAYEIVDRNGKVIKQVAPPNFSGKCVWEISKHPTTEKGNWAWIAKARLYLSINPTRYIRNHPNAPCTEKSARAIDQEPCINNEYGLDGNTNWIPNTKGNQKAFSENQGCDSVIQHIRGIKAAFEKELTRVCDYQFISHGHQEYYNLKKCETYFEWKSTDPIRLTRQIGSYLQTFSKNNTDTKQYSSDGKKQHDGLLVKTKHSAGEDVKVYAKTNRRVRFEVTHTLSGKSRFQFPRAYNELGNPTRAGGHTFKSLAGLKKHLKRIEMRATLVTNRILSHISKQSERPHCSPAPIEAFFKIFEAYPNPPSICSDIIRQLLSVGAISSRGIPCLQNAITALKAKGILESNGNGMYVPTAPFRDPLDVLRETNAAGSLRTRIRRRPRPPVSQP